MRKPQQKVYHNSGGIFMKADNYIRIKKDKFTSVLISVVKKQKYDTHIFHIYKEPGL